MKNTVFTTLLILFLATAAHAQFMFEGGLNYTNLNEKSGGTKLATKSKAGEAVGIAAGISLSPANHVYFEPGVYFASTGAKVPGPPNGTIQFNTINIPFNIEYKSGYRCGKRFFCGIGPYVAEIMGGSYNYDQYNGIPATSGTYTISPTNGFNIKRYEVGIGANIGYLFKQNFFFRAHYQMGFTNLYAIDPSTNSLKQSAFGLTIGYAIRSCGGRKGNGGFGTRGNDHWRGIKKLKWSRHQFDRRQSMQGL